MSTETNQIPSTSLAIHKLMDKVEAALASNQTELLRHLAAEIIDHIDSLLLQEPSHDIAGLPIYDKIFEIIIKRLEIIQPCKKTLRILHDQANHTPALAAALYKSLIVSMGKMLNMVGIKPKAPVAAHVLLAIYTMTFNRWLHESDSTLPSTMAFLNNTLHNSVMVKILRRTIEPN